jgi:hypothetical protein
MDKLCLINGDNLFGILATMKKNPTDYSYKIFLKLNRIVHLSKSITFSTAVALG